MQGSSIAFKVAKKIKGIDGAKFYDLFLSKSVYFFAFFGPIMSIPQIYQAYFVSTAGISLITLWAYTINSVFWMAYAHHHKEKQLVFTELLWTIVHMMLLYKVMFG